MEHSLALSWQEARDIRSIIALPFRVLLVSRTTDHLIEVLMKPSNQESLDNLNPGGGPQDIRITSLITENSCSYSANPNPSATINSTSTPLYPILEAEAES